jgi:NAD(P)-dependent dehydrogenase (short-subunit alcohol dehydrogenase family)
MAGRVALVTGGNRGIGLSIVRLLAEHGGSVVMGCRDIQRGEALARSLNNKQLDVRAVHLDVTQPAIWQRAIESVETSHGRLNVLVNNAGMTTSAGLLDCDVSEWEKVISTNQTGVFLGMKYVAPAIKRAGGGSIVNISSVHGTVGSEFGIAYHATKGAVNLLTRAAALALAPAIRVNCVSPALTETEMAATIGPERVRERVATYPLGRAARPDEVANVVLFLASDESSFVTGSNYRVDGGSLAGVKRAPTGPRAESAGER